MFDLLDRWPSLMNDVCLAYDLMSTRVHIFCIRLLVGLVVHVAACIQWRLIREGRCEDTGDVPALPTLLSSTQSQSSHHSQIPSPLPDWKP
jgi:hypothetical protein